MVNKEMLLSPERFDPKKAAATGPGQGAQSVGMGKEFYEKSPAARETFEEANDVLGMKFSKLMFEGPEKELNLTYNTQPAILIASVAAARAFEERAGMKIPSFGFGAGHSVGEYSMMVIKNIVDFSVAVGLVYRRGKAMYAKGREQDGCMVAILGQDTAHLQEICKQAEVEIANINCPGQAVLSGKRSFMDKAVKILRSEGVNEKRIVPLEVGGAFHCSLTREAADELKEDFEKTKYKDSETPLIGNVEAKPLCKAGEFPNELWRQIFNCVQWERSVREMVNGGAAFLLEFGPGQVLTNLAKRIDNRAKAINLGTLEAIESFARQYC